MLTPGRRSAAVDVAAVIKFALVGIDQAAAATPSSRGHEGNTLIFVGFVPESDEGRTPQRCLGQTSAGEALQSDRTDDDTGGCGCNAAIICSTSRLLLCVAASSSCR